MKPGDGEIVCVRRRGEPVRVHDLPGDGPARERFEAWIGAAGASALGALLDALAYREWLDRTPVPVRFETGGKSHVKDSKVSWRLTPADLKRIKAAAIAAVEAAGGRVAVGPVTATVAGGELRITMG